MLAKYYKHGQKNFFLAGKSDFKTKDKTVPERKILSLLSALVVFVVAFTLFCQVRSLVIKKAFWLDEWFIIYSIKFSSYHDLFGNLFAIQQFPRIYLSMIKWTSSFFNYSYLSLRAFPFMIQLVNVYLIVFVLSKVLYGKSSKSRYIFILFFLSFYTTLVYFGQVKPYTMDLFFAILVMLAFDFFTRRPSNSGSFQYWAYSISFFFGPFFSYTFPIVASPLMFILVVRLLTKNLNGFKKWQLLFPLLLFFAAIVLNYFTDLQFVLNDKQQYANFDALVMHYSSFAAFTLGMKNIAWLFGSIFFFNSDINVDLLSILYPVKIFVYMSSFIGLAVIFHRAFKSSFSLFKSGIHTRRRDRYDQYFILLFLVTLLLYFLEKLPLGAHRINYFCFFFVSWFFLNGSRFLVNRLPHFKPLLFLIIAFAACYPALAFNMREFTNKNVQFDQKIYDNIRIALKTAKANGVKTIIVKKNEFYPSSILPDEESLIVKTHYAFNPADSMLVTVHGDPQEVLSAPGTEYPCEIISKQAFKIYPERQLRQ